jgi:hypothetical protein
MGEVLCQRRIFGIVHSGSLKSSDLSLRQVIPRLLLVPGSGGDKSRKNRLIRQKADETVFYFSDLLKSELSRRSEK